MNIASNIAKSPVVPSTGFLLAEARQARGYSLDDVAETTGLTVEEVTALENDADFDKSRIRRAAAALGVLDRISGAYRA
ncbi:transcriptional regulator with XRE-family HTH domain [Rhizobium laguerreae]|uniref:Transcriptional regulator with XRE-family HTH domain n=1 Tax=Rhizobium laguerreae TaxID=1076926 RepID=A0ABR6GIL3_9HYPH|nr:helix-turn-helix domain-containing protein [Rhizobium laguerreae]MBB3166152.1 transcriptional regulator with XRE-family HTH domain [Rhizobium laguerreae]OOO52544.1 transcriptional regulator [Rhizobium laguerreae]